MQDSFETVLQYCQHHALLCHFSACNTMVSALAYLFTNIITATTSFPITHMSSRMALAMMKSHWSSLFATSHQAVMVGVALQKMGDDGSIAFCPLQKLYPR